MYVLETTAAEIARLEAQAAVLAPHAAAMFDSIGVGPGWHCLDLGCGPGDVARALADRVGAGGQVLGLDMDTRLLAHARVRAPGNLDHVEGDACASGLGADRFDLVHGRFLCGATAPAETLIREAIRLARPGGTVAMQEQDLGTLACYPPHPAFARLKALLASGLEQSGHGHSVARRLFGVMRAAGLEGVRYRPVLVGCQAGEPLGQWLPEIVGSLRRTLLGGGLVAEPMLDAALDACRAHLADPGTTMTLYTVVQVWGRKPTA